MADQQGAESQVEDLKTLLDVTRQLAVTIELPALLASVERAARQVLRCERASVFLYDAKEQELYSKVATGVEQLRIPATQGITGQVVRTREVINVPDAYADPRFNPEVDKQTGFKTRNLLTFPLIDHDGELVGVLQLLNKRGDSFDEHDEMLGQALCAQVAVALQRQLLLEQYAEKRRMEYDLSIARSIQQQFLPQDDPAVRGFDIAGWNKPADETGGDYYDFLMLPDGEMVIVVADATGHGIGPALVITACRAILRAVSSLTREISSALGKANDLLCEDLSGGRFVTAFVGLLKPEQGVLQYMSAGQGPLLLYRAATGEVEQLEATELPLGVAPWSDSVLVEQVSLSRGDIMLVLTDGFFEWTGPDDEEFGMGRVAEVVRGDGGQSSGRLIQQIYEAVIKFGGSSPQRDDLTAVVIKRL